MAAGHHDRLIHGADADQVARGNSILFMPHAPMIGAADEPGGCGCIPFFAAQIKTADPAAELRQSAGRHGQFAAGSAHRLRANRFNRVDGRPVAGSGRQPEEAAIGAGDDRASIRLAQHKDVAAIETVAHLLPVQPGIAADKHSAEFLVIQQTRIDHTAVAAIGNDRRHLAVRKTAIGGGEGDRSIVTGQHSAAVGRQQYPRGVSRVRKHVVHNHAGTGHALPGRA